jgi:antirestriction protein ArdC
MLEEKNGEHLISGYKDFRKRFVAGYLKSWMSVLDWKPESLIEVSSKAYKVYDYIMNRNAL